MLPLIIRFCTCAHDFFINNDITKCTLDVVYKGLGGAEKKFPKQGLRCVTGELVSLFKKYRPWRDDGSSGEEHDGIAGVPSLPRPRPSFVLEFPQNQRPILVADISLEASFLPLQVFPKIPSPVHSPSILRTSLRLSLPPPLFLPPTSANGAGFPKSEMQTVLNILQIVLVESAVAHFLPLFAFLPVAS